MRKNARLPRICQHCGRSFTAKRHRESLTVFCSRACYHARRTISVSDNTVMADRFWRKVDCDSDPDGCWIWQAAMYSNGYGMFVFHGQRTGAHRVAYTLTHGAIPDGLFVLHSCDVHACVNPNHLSVGTHEQNMRESAERGRVPSGDRSATRLHPERYPRGENHPSTTLKQTQVDEIRLRFAAGGASKVALAQEYGVNATTIANIVSHRTWK